jgi:adenosylhomocysteine nucleosidase
MKFGKLFVLIFAVTVTAASDRPADTSRPSLTAIIGASGEEVRIINDRIQDKQVEAFLGINFIRGKLNGRNVVLAQTGIGKVNAAMTTAVLLDHFHPAEVILMGTAGGINPNLQPGDIVIADKTIQHDFGELTANGFKPRAFVNPLDGKPNPCFFPSNARLVGLARQAAGNTQFTTVGKGKQERKIRCVTGIIATGDSFIASPAKKDELYRQLKADAVDMESAAAAQVCYQQSVPFIAIRSISDSADAKADADYEHFHQTAAANASRLVMAVVALLNGVSSE